MKKIIVSVLIITLFPLIVNAETVIKVGIARTYVKVEEFSLTIPSAELKIEQSIWKGFGLGFGFKKETKWGYSGYYLSLYPICKIQLSKVWFIATSLGIEYGLASSEYDKYTATYDEAGNLTAHQWIHLVQNAWVPFDALKKGSIGVIYPFWTISPGVKIWHIILESGFKVQMMEFKIDRCEFDSVIWLREKVIWKVVPSIFVQLGYRF